MTMNPPNRRSDTSPFDVIVIGAGMCGVIFVKYARDRGLRCLVLEKQDAIGGLWNHLPAWQDIQNRREDFSIDHVPIAGVRQLDVARYVRAWVDRFDLGPSIRLGQEVTSVERVGDTWRVRTPDETFRGRYLVAASGVQNDPWIPDIDRDRPSVVEHHSSSLQNPADLRDRRVTVVGSGASALDLLDLALQNDARTVDWVYRQPRWFMPTRRAKQRLWPNLREMAATQCMLPSPETMSAFLQGLLESEYDYFGLTDIKPHEPFDIRKHQLLPGRSRMIRDFDRITRHQSPVRGIEGADVVLADSERVGTDVVLWGTGYRMDLTYLDLDTYRDVHTIGALFPRLGSLVRSIDHPDLFFIGMTLGESTTSTPFLASVEARSIVSHVLGEADIPTTNTPQQVTHWYLLKYFARFDRANYPRFRWRIRYVLDALRYAVTPSTSIELRSA